MKLCGSTLLQSLKSSLKTAASACALFMAGGLVAPLVSLDEAYAADPIEIDVKGEASVVAGIVEGNADGDADAEISIKASTVFENGIEIGAVLDGRLDGQQPANLYSGGRYSSLLFGGQRGVGPMTSDAYLQGAYAYARGGFGQVIVGREHGVARTFAVTAPTIFRAVNVNDWRTDLTGLNDVHTVNDLSGYAAKISYLPPANFLGGLIGGLQLGVSYSPTLGECGERLCAPVNGLAAPDGTLLTESSNWEDVVEAALYYQRSLGNDLLLGLGASYVSADEAALSVSPIFADYEAYSLGLNLAYRSITIGGSIKTTNAGIADTQALDGDGYLAFDAGVTFKTGEERGDWGIMLGYGQSQANVFGPNPLDPSLFQDTQTAQAGVTYFLGRGITVGAAAQFVESMKPESVGGQEEAAAVVIESSIRF